MIDKTSRLKCLKNLSLAGCDITDVALRYIVQHLSIIENINLSSCKRITDAGIAQLASLPAATVKMLKSLNLSYCTLLTELSVEYLSKCEVLKFLDLRHTYISQQRVISFANSSKFNLCVVDEKLIKEKKQDLLTFKEEIMVNDKRKINVSYINELTKESKKNSNLHAIKDNNLFLERRQELT